MRYRLAYRLRARLQFRLFLWFGAAIVLTGLTLAAVFHLVGGWGGAAGVAQGKSQLDGVRAFVADRFERMWDLPVERDALVRALATNFNVDVAVTDASGARLATAGQPCASTSFVVPVVRDQVPLGSLAVCADRHAPRRGPIIVALLAAGVVLWAASGGLARRLARPYAELARVAQEIGHGRLSSRARLFRHGHGELGMLAEAVDDMARRIERQLAGQRELLAAVSHEIRTPLARIRLLIEMGRPTSDAKMLDELKREVVEIDALVGQLLANSRLEFAALAVRSLDAVEVARRALERAGIGEEALLVEATETEFEADPTLIARALANLIENAKAHGAGMDALRVASSANIMRFEVLDNGAGFSPGEAARVFAPFYSGKGNGGSLGLGLSLVKRIAEAHGGKAYAKNRDPKGACVGIELPMRHDSGEKRA